MMVRGKRQVTLAGAKVHHGDRAGRALRRERRGEARFVQCVIQHLHKLVDLLPLARHRGHQTLAFVGHAQILQERRVQRKKTALGSVVAGGGRGFSGRSGSGVRQADLAALADHQLPFALGGEQMPMAERAGLAEQLAHAGQAFGDGGVFGDVARFMVVHQTQAGLAPQHDHPGAQFEQITRCGPRLGQHQLDATLFGHAAGQHVEKTFAPRQVGQGLTLRSQRGVTRSIGRWNGRGKSGAHAPIVPLLERSAAGSAGVTLRQAALNGVTAHPLR